jgi:hypothetical protein
MGPAISFVVSQLFMMLYLGHFASRLYEVSFSEIIEWKRAGKIAAVCVLCAPILVVGKVAVDQMLVRGMLFGTAYLLIYIVVLKAVGVAEGYELLLRLSRAKSIRWSRT